MKKLLFILVLCLPSFGTITLVQSASGGSVSSSGTTPFTVTTSAAGFSSPTTSGNFLVCVAWARQNAAGISGQQAETTTFSTPSGGGLSWHDTSGVGGLREWTYGGLHPAKTGTVLIFYIVNAPSTSATFTVAATAPGTGITLTLSVEFSLYEFSGVQQSDGVGAAAVIDAQGAFLKDANTGGVLVGGTINPNNADLIVSVYSGDDSTGSTVGPGSGYTLGQTATVAVLGQVQYKLNSPTGSQSDLYASNPATFFGGAGLAFKPLSASAPRVQRHKGYVF